MANLMWSLKVRRLFNLHKLQNSKWRNQYVRPKFKKIIRFTRKLPPAFYLNRLFQILTESSGILKDKSNMAEQDSKFIRFRCQYSRSFKVVDYSVEFSYTQLAISKAIKFQVSSKLTNFEFFSAILNLPLLIYAFWVKIRTYGPQQFPYIKLHPNQVTSCILRRHIGSAIFSFLNAKLRFILLNNPSSNFSKSWYFSTSWFKIRKWSFKNCKCMVKISKINLPNCDHVTHHSKI